MAEPWTEVDADELRAEAEKRGALKRRGSMEDRRSAILRGSQLLSVEEVQEQKRHRAQAIKAVRAAIAAESAKDKISRPLRRFGCSLHLTLVHHKRVKTRGSIKGLPRVQRRVVSIKDKLTFNELVCPGGLVEREMEGIKRGGARCLIYQYFDRRGRGVKITKQSELHRWLDEMWDKQPPELHIYDGDALAAEVEDRMELISSIFAEHDVDNSNSLSMGEVKDMLLNLQITEQLGVSKEDFGTYISEEFTLADRDKNNQISFDEFVDYFNSLQDYIQDSLTRENRFMHTFSMFKEAYVQAKSERLPLKAIVEERGGLLTLDHEGHDYGIEVRFGPECLFGSDDDFDSSDGWVRAQTLLENKVDYFMDETDALGMLFSAIVWVEFEDSVEVADDFTVRFPHSFYEQSLSKSDIVVVYGSFDTGTWSEVDEEAFTFMPGNPETGLLPSLVVRLFDQGIVAAFGRNDKKLKQRVQCACFVPEKVIPLETERLKTYVVPALPDQLHLLEFLEKQSRGSNIRGGISDVFVIREGAAVELSVLQGSERQSRSFQWKSDISTMSWNIDPANFLPEDLDEDVPSTGHFYTGEFTVTVSINDIMARRMSVSSRHSSAKNACTIPCKLSIHEFPSPSEPRELEVLSRTQTNMCVQWRMPHNWGGCALSHYQVEIRERTNKGVVLPWAVAAHSQICKADIDKSIFACEIRVRAFNCASSRPGPWSEVVIQRSEREEMAARKLQGASRKRLFGGRRQSVAGAVAEGGIAAVVQGEVGDDVHSRRSVRMTGWSDFKRVLGDFYLFLGVGGGVDGKLFDLTIEEIEEIIVSNKDSVFEGEIDLVAFPLLGLALCGVWVLETLAHHTEDAAQWVEFMNDVAGLVYLAAKQQTRQGDMIGYKHHQELCKTVVHIYETLRQCEPNGYITKQLEHRYEKKLKKLLVSDWEDNLAQLRNEVSTHVMALILHNRSVASSKLPEQ